MPTIYDNIELHLLDALRRSLHDARAADFCVGYFNLRGWGKLAGAVTARLDGSQDHCVRVLVGMRRTPADEADSKQFFALTTPGCILTVAFLQPQPVWLGGVGKDQHI